MGRWVSELSTHIEDLGAKGIPIKKRKRTWYFGLVAKVCRRVVIKKLRIRYGD